MKKCLSLMLYLRKLSLSLRKFRLWGPAGALVKVHRSIDLSIFSKINLIAYLDLFFIDNFLSCYKKYLIVSFVTSWFTKCVSPSSFCIDRCCWGCQRIDEQKGTRFVRQQSKPKKGRTSWKVSFHSLIEVPHFLLLYFWPTQNSTFPFFFNFA